MSLQNARTVVKFFEIVPHFNDDFAPSRVEGALLYATDLPLQVVVAGTKPCQAFSHIRHFDHSFICL